MQPERFSVLSILGIRGSPFIWRNDFWLVTNQTLRGWRSDHQKFVRKVFANPKCFIPFSQKHRKIRLKVKWNVHLVFSKIRSETVVKSVYLQRYFSFFPFGKEGRTSDFRVSSTENKNEKPNYFRLVYWFVKRKPFPSFNGQATWTVSFPSDINDLPLSRHPT